MNKTILNSGIIFVLSFIGLMFIGYLGKEAGESGLGFLPLAILCLLLLVGSAITAFVSLVSNRRNNLVSSSNTHKGLKTILFIILGIMLAFILYVVIAWILFATNQIRLPFMVY